jgi:hypothetical protein
MATITRDDLMVLYYTFGPECWGRRIPGGRKPACELAKRLRVYAWRWCGDWIVSVNRPQKCDVICKEFATE